MIMKLKEDELLDDHMRVAFGYHFIIEKVAEYSGSSVKGIWSKRFWAELIEPEFM